MSVIIKLENGLLAKSHHWVSMTRLNYTENEGNMGVWERWRGKW